MRFLRLPAASPAFALLLCLTAERADALAPRILFIGNSLTFYNTGLDSVLRSLSVSLGNPIETRRLANPGWTLAQHFAEPATHAALRDGKWDYVALQELSDGTLTDPARFRTATVSLDNAIRSAGARTLLYMTWTYVEEPVGMIDSIAGIYNAQGALLDAPVVPVGWAWQRVLDETDLPLYADNRHPTPRGTYLAACLWYARLTGRSPVGAAYRGPGNVVPAADAAYLQRVAYETWDEWRRRPYPLPGRLEGERFQAMEGVASEKCQDEGGGRDLAYLQAGDWFDFPVEARETGRYLVSYRVAAQASAGRVELAGAGGRVLDTVDFPVTGGFQAWRTVTYPLRLEAGRATLRCRVLAGGFNLNWMDFVLDSAATPVLAAKAARTVRHGGPALVLLRDGPRTVRRAGGGISPELPASLRDLRGRSLPAPAR